MIRLPAPRIRGNHRVTHTDAVIYLPARASQLSRMPLRWGLCGPAGAALVTARGVTYLNPR